MDPADWANQTVLHPLGLLALFTLGSATMLLPRRLATVPMLLLACFISSQQRISLLTLDFTLIRVLVLCGWIRVLFRGETRGFRWQPVDLVLLAWVVAATTTPVLREGSLTIFVNRLGSAFDAVGLYFLFRLWLRSWADTRALARAIAVISVPVAAAFMVEYATGRNLFAALGGVPEYTLMRQGKLRCQGAFSHPIMAGCFFASLLPLVAGRFWLGGHERSWALVGSLVMLVIIVLTASSTPLAGVAAGIAGAACFRLRPWMRAVRWLALGGVVVLHMVMTAPVWHLISRIDLVGGSTGWHRFYLIDRTIHNFSEWWLLGTGSTAHWGRAMGDVTNQYVLEAARGGLVSLLLFIAMLALAYRGVGRMCRARRGDRRGSILAWSLGVGLFCHTMMFFAVSYFGQIVVVWYLQLALIGSMEAATVAPLPRRRRRVRRDPSRAEPPGSVPAPISARSST